MDPSSSHSDRISVLCSTAGEYCSTSSGTSSPNSRRNSVSDSLVKDEQYWERRRKNNDASKRSREKRRQSDMAMEQKIMALARENELLKSRLGNKSTEPMVVEYASLPSSSATVPDHKSYPPSMSHSTPMVQNPLQPSVIPSLTPQMLQLCHLQAALQQQYRPPVTPLLSLGSAFTPFNKESSVIMRTSDRQDRTSPDSSSDRANVIRKAPSPMERPQPSLLGQLLSARRTSPTVPQSRTEHISGLSSPPRPMCSKSDSESNSSFASFSPSHSSEEQDCGSSAIRQALNGDQPTSYVDRRKRNNEAAKRCRANRRAVFEYRSRRVQLLEGENEQLKSEISRLKQELEQQKALLASIPRME